MCLNPCTDFAGHRVKLSTAVLCLLMGLDSLQKGWSHCLISSLWNDAPVWPWILTPLTSGTVCASQGVCGNVSVHPSVLLSSHSWLGQLHLYLCICQCAYACNYLACWCVFVWLHASDINSRACQWPLAGPVELSVSALMLGQGRRSEHRMSLQRPTHTTHPCSKLMMTPSGLLAPRLVPWPQELPCQLPDYKDPKHSAEGGNSSWWQPSIVATQAAHTTAGGKNSISVSVVLSFNTASMPNVWSIDSGLSLFKKTGVYSITISTKLDVFLFEWKSGSRVVIVSTARIPYDI